MMEAAPGYSHEYLTGGRGQHDVKTECNTWSVHEYLILTGKILMLINRKVNTLHAGKYCRFSADFLKLTFRKNISGIPVANGLDPDQARRFVGPGLGPNGLQKLSK